MTLDMAALPERTTDLVNAAPILPGRYQEIRFILSGAFIRVAGDGVYATPDYDEVPWGLPVVGELVIPSLGQSGLKVKLTEPLAIGRGAPVQTWLLRFDVAESFGHPTGGTKWVMHPVIFATPVGATASIAVAVDTRSLPDADKRFTVRLDDAEGYPESRVDVDASAGHATVQIPYLLPVEGPYRLKLVTFGGAAIATNPALPDSIRLNVGERLQVTVQATGVAP